MRLSNYFLPTLRNNPKEARIISHRLMLRSAMINQSISGIYVWLPMGLRVLEKVQNIICEEHDKLNFQKILMPTIQSTDLWKATNRYDNYGKEMLCFKDRHGRELLYGPTNEEVITNILKNYVQSYKKFPQIFYQIQWKFRDEIRPRFGIIRCREFLMKDAYSFDLDYQSACHSYTMFFNCYLNIFSRLGISVIPVRANSGAIGGEKNQEFHVLTSSGESTIYYDQSFDCLIKDKFLSKNNFKNLYAASEEIYLSERHSISELNLKSSKSIEVGHIFYFGKKYSNPLGAKIIGLNGNIITLEMGSYGIGVSRLVAAIIEANHDDKGIVWPVSVAPFMVGLINAKMKSSYTYTLSEDLYEKLKKSNIDVLYDDREEQSGIKFTDIDLIGIPYQIIIGNTAIERDLLEWKDRKTGKIEILSVDSIINKIKKINEV